MNDTTSERIRPTHTRQIKGGELTRGELAKRLDESVSYLAALSTALRGGRFADMAPFVDKARHILQGDSYTGVKWVRPSIIDLEAARDDS